MPETSANTDVLVAIDVQNDFCPGGALAAKDGDGVVPVINRLSRLFDHFVVSQDWHPADHHSFASQHPGAKPFESIEAAYGPQTLWPEHCVQGSPGAEFHRHLDVTRAELVLRKGYRREIDSYSALYENDRKTPTGLGGYLRERGLSRLYFAGIATDYCVAFSAIDAAAQGFDVFVILDGCRAIDLQGSLAAALERMRDAGVTFLDEADFYYK
jgi:nicotinamidase/pyrazinamidase